MTFFKKIRKFIIKREDSLKKLTTLLLLSLGILLALTGIGAIAGIPVTVGLLAGIASAFSVSLLPVAIAALVTGAAIAFMPERAANLLFAAIDLGLDLVAKTLGLIIYPFHLLANSIEYAIKHKNTVKSDKFDENSNLAGKSKSTTVWNQLNPDIFASGYQGFLLSKEETGKEEEKVTAPKKESKPTPGFFAEYFYGLLLLDKKEAISESEKISAPVSSL